MEIKQPQAWGYDGGFDVPVTENRYENTYTGWWYTDPSENMKVSWDDDIPNIWKNKTCSKAPTSV